MKRKISFSNDVNKEAKSIPNYFISTNQVNSKNNERIGNQRFDIKTLQDYSDASNEGLDDMFPGYTVRNFNKMLEEILGNINDKCLFSEEELEIINSYKKLSNTSKKLFLRLYGKQWKWHRFDKENTGNLKICFKMLLDNNFINSDCTSLNIRDKLELLFIDEIDKLAKKFNIKSSSKKKQELINSIIKATDKKNEISHYFISKNVNSLLTKIEKELANYLKFTYKLTNTVRNTFCKVTLLFSITTSRWDDSSHLGEQNRNELFHLLQIDKGQISLPVYKLSRISNIFQAPVNLQNYVTAMEYCLKLNHFFDNNKLDEAYDIYLAASTEYTVDFLQTEVDTVDRHLSGFMKRFSLKSLVVRIYSLSVALLEKRKQHADAVVILKILIAVTNSDVISKSRGKWYFRLCVNYRTHLKSPADCKYWLEVALRDRSVPDSFRLNFTNRLDRINKSSSHVRELEDSNDGLLFVTSSPDCSLPINISIKTIKAPRQFDVDDGSQRPRYIWRDGGSVVHCHVEDYVIYHYTGGPSAAYTNGIHGETGTFVVYFLLLFYDVIYADVPDAFYTTHQTVPLDMFSSTFRSNRSRLIVDKFDWFNNVASPDDIAHLLVTNWRDHSNEAGLVADWSIIGGEDNLLSLFSCLGIELVLAICDRFLDNFSYWSSGMPDLVLWHCSRRVYEIVEVKGPGDRLSDKQTMWIAELQKMGANVCLCQVEGTCHKKL